MFPKAKAFHQKQHIEHNNNNEYNHVNVCTSADVTMDLEQALKRVITLSVTMLKTTQTLQ